MSDKQERANMTMTDLHAARDLLATTVQEAVTAFYETTGMRPEVQVHELPRANQNEGLTFGVHVRATME